MFSSYIQFILNIKINKREPLHFCKKSERFFLLLLWFAYFEI